MTPKFLARPCADYEEITVDNSVKTLTAAKVAASRFVWLQIAAGPIRMTPNGSTPTTTFGTQLFDLDQFEAAAVAAAQLKFIREGATNGTVRAAYYL